MENKVSVWKANLNSGIIMGLAGIVFSLILYFLDQTLNKTLPWIWFLALIVLLFFFIKSYRDNYLKGFITYGQSLGAGVIIMLYYAIISAAFGFILYKFIDPGLIDKTLAMTEATLVERGFTESMIEQSMKMQAKIMTPGVMNAIGIFSNVFVGTILSLIISIFTRKEGNPLIDDAIEE
jgi:hypothetical protein